MIYAYEPKVTTGPYGTVVTHRSESATILGKIEDTVFVHSHEPLVDQPDEINLREVILTQDQKSELKSQSLAKLQKETLRSKIELDVGDLHDLLADCMKMIEMNLLLTSRLAADYFQTEPMSESDRVVYATRNQTFLDSVNSGQTQLRASFEDANEMMIKLMTRYSHIQEMVKNDYLDKLKEIGLD